LLGTAGLWKADASHAAKRPAPYNFASLLAAITQLVAPPHRTGAILVGGVEVSELPLQQHRAALAVIPQEPHTLGPHTLLSPSP